MKNSMVSPVKQLSDCAASARRNCEISSSLRRTNVFHLPSGPAACGSAIRRPRPVRRGFLPKRLPPRTISGMAGTHTHSSRGGSGASAGRGGIATPSSCPAARARAPPPVPRPASAAGVASPELPAGPQPDTAVRLMTNRSVRGRGLATPAPSPFSAVSPSRVSRRSTSGPGSPGPTGSRCSANAVTTARTTACMASFIAVLASSVANISRSSSAPPAIAAAAIASNVPPRVSPPREASPVPGERPRRSRRRRRRARPPAWARQSSARVRIAIRAIASSPLVNPPT